MRDLEDTCTFDLGAALTCLDDIATSLRVCDLGALEDEALQAACTTGVWACDGG